jgi:integrase/recombinase XerD
VLAALYDITDDRHLPVEVRGEASGLRYAARPRHRLSETETAVDRASDAEVLGLLGACRSARDRFIVTAMARAGLRSGEVTGLRREDMHLIPDATALGCLVPGAHLHVRRRDNPNGAWAKSRRARAVPADELLVLAYDTYWFERDECRPARRCDFVLVNLFREPLGAPMRPGALNELLAALSRRAGLAREIHPHMLRHCFGSNVMEAGGALDEAQALLGHASPASTQVYLHPAHDRLRRAVDRVAVRFVPGDAR